MEVCVRGCVVENPIKVFVVLRSSPNVMCLPTVPVHVVYVCFNEREGGREGEREGGREGGRGEGGRNTLL